MSDTDDLRDHSRIVAEAIDLCWKATPYGETDDGDVHAYLLPKGVVHRLVGALQGAGYSASLRVPHQSETRPDGDRWRWRCLTCPAADTGYQSEHAASLVARRHDALNTTVEAALATDCPLPTPQQDRSATA